MHYRMEDYRETANYIGSRLSAADTAIVLGSGLGGFADRLQGAVELPYCEIPHFPVATVASHRGTLLGGRINEKPVYCLAGRFHYYEGYSMEEIAYAVRVLHLLGVKNLILTNAAGAIRSSFRVGEFMLLTDYIKFFHDSPARGQLPPEFGSRFFDMTHPYDPLLQKAARKGAAGGRLCLYGRPTV